MKAVHLVVLSLLAVGASGQNLLKPGPHTVGFRSEWQLDSTRSYNTKYDDGTSYSARKSPRPILVNVWYPAQRVSGKPLVHGSYLDIRARSQPLSKFADKLISYNRGVIAVEAFGKEEKKFTAQEKAAFVSLLNEPTRAYRNAKPRSGKFPLVIYHSGNGSSFDDNTSLCEYLASLGYVVIGSAFQQDDGKGFNIEGGKGAAADFRFLISYGHRLPNVLPEKVGLVGHSAGAHASITYQTITPRPVDAIVSLDTTQDYHSLKLPLWNFTSLAVEKLERFNRPIMFAADTSAFFELADRMIFATRWYFYANSIGHNDYISQGVLRRIYKQKLEPKKENLDTEIKVRSIYTSLCNSIGLFLDTHLKGLPMPGPQAIMQGRHRGDRLAFIEVTPKGANGPAAYDPSSDFPPSPRQLRPILWAEGASRVAEILVKFKAQKTESLYDSTFAFGVVYELVAQKRVDDAKVIFEAYKAAQVNVVEKFTSWAGLLKAIKMVKMEEDMYRKLLLIDPGNEEATKRLKEIGGPPLLCFFQTNFPAIR